VDDRHRRPGDRDRAALVARIEHAARAGRIAPADRDIRLANVEPAQSLVELDLMSRDLDQLEDALPAAEPAAPVWTGPSATPLSDQVTEQAVGLARTTVRSIGVVTALVVALVAAGLGASAYLGSNGSDSPRRGDLLTPEPIPGGGVPEGAGDEPVGDPSPAAGPSYGLDAAGIRWFLAEYGNRFATTRVVDLTLYPEYAVVQVPLPGTGRHAGALYRTADGWRDFGGISANFPGSRPVDLQDLDVQALAHNIARARQALGVESVSQTYVVIGYRPDVDPAPHVDIHVSNEFGESGYLATTPDGTIERAYPYQP
jgi:hypothetical protein